MALTVGSRLGAFEILGTLGEGGMGVVYRARDTRLKRDVALKVLPEAFAQDADRVARFQREAELLATLTHPHIAAIHGLEDTGDTRALVLELVDGETLADQIARGPIPVDEAMPIARQIADALDYAHEHGVLHRDLKPANIKLTTEGQVKVLDFGLARALQDPKTSGPQDLAQSPTITSPALTRAGVVLGTAAYMSPEQARGRAVDKRADIWAFGCVLYEMLTGRRAFAGEELADTLTAVMRDAPDWSAVPADTPAPVRDLLVRCLVKDPRERLRDIGEAHWYLDGSRRVVATGQQAAVADARASSRLVRVLPWAIAAALLIMLGLTWAGTSPPAPAPAVTRFTIPAARVGASVRMFAVSPDGRTIAMGMNGQIHLRPMDALNWTPLRGTQFMTHPVFSPDGRSITVLSRQSLVRVLTDGGVPEDLLAGELTSDVTSLSWSAGRIWFATGEGIFWIPESGGSPTRVVDGGDTSGEEVFGPHLLPDGRHLLFTARPREQPRWDAANIVVQSVETGARTTLVRGATDGAYLASGHLVFLREGALMAQAFDPATLRLEGTPTPVIEGVMTQGFGRSAQFAVSAGGTLVYVPDRGEPVTLAWRDRDGREQPIDMPARAYVRPRISPDGTRIVVADRNNDLWLWDIARESATALTSNGSGGQIPIWTPDGRRVIFMNPRGLFALPADGASAAERLRTPPNPEISVLSTLTPDGTTVFLNVGPAMHTMPLTGDSASRLLIEDGGSLTAVDVSPDGRRIAYVATVSGQNEVYVRPFPATSEARVQVTSGGGGSPRWTPNGRELLYLDRNREMKAVRVATEPTLAVSAPISMFPGVLPNPANSNPVSRHWDIMPDGSRIVFVKVDAGNRADAELVVVQHWFEELKALVPPIAR